MEVTTQFNDNTSVTPIKSAAKTIVSAVDKENLPNVAPSPANGKAAIVAESTVVAEEAVVDEDFVDAMDESSDAMDYHAFDDFDYVDFCIDSEDMDDAYLYVDEDYITYINEEGFDHESLTMDDSSYEENSEDLQEMIAAYGLSSHTEALSLIGRSQVLAEFVADRIASAPAEEVQQYEKATREIDSIHRHIKICLRKFHTMVSQTEISMEVEDDSVAFFRELLSRFVGTVLNVASLFAEQSECDEIAASQVIGALEFFGIHMSLERICTDDEDFYFDFDFDKVSFSQLVSYVQDVPITAEAMDFLQIAFEDYLYIIVHNAVNLQILHGYEIAVDASDLYTVLRTWRTLPCTNNFVARMGY